MASPISPSSTSDIRQLLIIDSRLPDSQSLLAGLDSNTAVIYLNDQQDGLSQISAALEGYNQLDAVQIVSHGSPASLQLGASTIDTETLLAQQVQLESWRDALSDDADILLYGCNVADGEAGREFVDTLAELTGADIAASDDLTGAASLGGDWELESTNGEIDADLLTPVEFNSLLTTGKVIAGDGSGGGGGGSNGLYSAGDGGDGGGDNDTLQGMAGNDVLFGDGHGGAGGDKFLDSSGNDGRGGGGDDTLNGGGGDDILFGDGFNGVASFSTISSELAGGSGGSAAYPPAGTAGAGGTGFGGAAGGATETAGTHGGDDQVSIDDTGQTHWNSIKSAIDDSFQLSTYLLSLETGAGDDILNGGAGSDYLFGMGGNDTFVFEIDDAGASDEDAVYDWGNGTDKIKLTLSGEALNEAAVNQVLSTQANDGEDRIFVYSNGGKQVTVRLIGKKDTVLTASNFEKGTASLNQPPAVDLDGNDSSGATDGNFNTSFTEGGGSVAIVDSDVSLSDVEGDDIQTVTVTLTNDQNGADEYLTSTAANANITVSNNNTDTITLTNAGSASAADFEAVLQGIKWANSSDDPGSTNRTVTVVANDGSNGAAATTTIIVNGVNDTPTLSATGDNSSAIGAGSAVSVFSATAIDPIESESIASVTFTVGGLTDAGNEELILDGSTVDLMTTGTRTDSSGGNIAYQVTYNNGGAALILITGPAGGSAANTVLQTALNGMTYQNTLSSATTGDRTFTLSNVTDVGTGDNSWTGTVVSTLSVVDGDTRRRPLPVTMAPKIHRWIWQRWEWPQQ